MTEKKFPSGWISVAIVALAIGGYRAFTGSSLTRDFINAFQSRPEPAINSASPTGNALGAHGQSSHYDGSLRLGSDLTDLQQQAIGFLAQTVCSTRKYDYTPEQTARKIDFFIEAKNAESIRQWMMEPKVLAAASTLSMAFNTNCTNYDAESDSAKRAYQLINEL